MFAALRMDDMAKAKSVNAYKVVADNRKARFNYELLEKYEAGVVLLGSEVKALRKGKASIKESYISIEKGEAYLINSHISEYSKANRNNHEPKRIRKLLLHKRQIGKLDGAIQREGFSVVPTKMYFDNSGRVKVEIASAKGRKIYDKRQVQKDRSWGRDKMRILRDRG